MDRSAQDCLHLFDMSVKDGLKDGWSAGVLNQRTKTVKAGPMLYVSCYPVWDTAKMAEAVREAARRERNREASVIQNMKIAKRKLVALINANFGKGDLLPTLEYGFGKQPGTDEKALKDVQKYMDCVRRMWKKRSSAPMKYIYIVEKTQSKQFGTRWHVHMILTGGVVTREELEQKWIERHGGIANVRIAQPTEKHLAGFASYLMLDKTTRSMLKDGKNPQWKVGKRMWNSSKNLDKPVETTADKKISIRKAGQIAKNAEENAKEVFAKLYPDCELLEIDVRQSKWATGVYIYAELRDKRGRSAKRERIDTGGNQQDRRVRGHGSAGRVRNGTSGRKGAGRG